MQIHHILAGIFLFAGITNNTAEAQQLRKPMDIPVLLSGNFGELRSNHFHSGIDFKTQGVEGKPIHSVQDGYVSRISVSPWGYGNGLYITHPDGTTTVYGHLQKFSQKITAYLKEKQYEQESFNVNLSLTPDELPVKEGELVALSGNTGSSGGPHLHFEVRDTETEEPMDPIEYYKDLIKDTQAPKIQGIMVYSMPGKGVVNGSRRKLELKPVTAKNGKQTLTGKIEAWGEIGLAVKGYDYMDNTSNIYGIKDITLTADSQVIFHSNLDRFAFDESRYLNSFTDFEEWKEHRSFYIKSFVDPGNRLRFIESLNHGILTIDEPRTYHLTYQLADAFGNTTQLSIQIEGKEQPIPEVDTENTELFHWWSDNRFGAKGIRLTIPKGNLYDDLYFRYSVKEDSTALGATHILHNKPVAFHKSAKLSLRLQTDTLENKQQYGIVRLQNGRRSWTGGVYRNGWVDADIKEMGSYTLGQDLVPPTITPLNPATWVSKQAIALRLSDNLSGVQTYRGEIDGQYVLFEMNSKSVITYHFDKERLARGKHTLKLVVTDACGNQSTYTYPFTW
ncbi:M23 family metallopeptidase [Parabacteroides goldsteinii]|uniref:Peptidoglycan DD-metalloendopeptidase family protein n=1 Tax=Parabacteroides goldsteinii TaxID=328812 RepID=A0A6G1ZJG7_9BACT|nr:M23 family metallopeptidase [Parabacteroides goldsteinii]MRX94639.1 peptidoglycan DD-metalloendopeptidase family protein [Parabacteroides goldsteinii]MRX99685.1 peptidoglycan DD-metalloendopeptidase family protein [Parabacteroides goldsteinii]MRY04645.1 peptidoglycan DD-metalloendopeptidase family protein [Parabacteroides goldsteinii]MRY14059.1 peptidoglycan DD-metalloendopeptidase family protein [Parabacteroides goldsteinii]MRY23451.1 peptidoglycan DD-metalloendopeptidase family protein [P